MLNDDQQFNWCLKKYPDLELSHHHMQPDLYGLHLTNSVNCDIDRKTHVTSPLEVILIFSLDKTTPTFEQQGLAIDWVSFTFSSLSCGQEQKLISSFYALGFSLYRLDKLTNNCSAGGLSKLSKLKSPILVDNNHSFQILLVGYFEKTSLVFPGLSGQALYDLAKNRQVDSALLNSATLSRFDINHCRICNSQKIGLLPKFFVSCYNKLRSSGKHNSVSLTPKGDIFTIGCRRSQNFSRVYLKGTTLKFENEMKGNFLKNISLYFYRTLLSSLSRICVLITC
jgi:hypothetical protein